MSICRSEGFRAVAARALAAVMTTAETLMPTAIVTVATAAADRDWLRPSSRHARRPAIGSRPLRAVAARITSGVVSRTEPIIAAKPAITSTALRW
jgi:hypothetical protein